MSQAYLGEKKSYLVYIMRGTAWPRITAAGEGTFRPRAAAAGFSRPEAGSVQWPRSHGPKLANKATKQASSHRRARDGTPATHTAQLLLLLLASLLPPLRSPPNGCEPPIPATNNPSKAERGGPPTGAPSPHHINPAPGRSG